MSTASRIRFYGFYAYTNIPREITKEELFDDEIILNYNEEIVMNLLTYLKTQILYEFDFDEIIVFIENCKCKITTDLILPIGKTLHVIHKDFKMYMVELSSHQRISEAIVQDLNTAINIMDSGMENYDYRMGYVRELNWNGTIKKTCAQRYTRPYGWHRKKKLPNVSLSEHLVDVKNRDKMLNVLDRLYIPCLKKKI